MANFKKLLYLAVVKSQTIFGFFQLVISLLAWLAIVITLEVINMGGNHFECDAGNEDTATKEHVAALCLQQYVNLIQLSSPVFQRNFALISVGFLLIIWLLYIVYVTPRIRYFSEARPHNRRTKPRSSYLLSLYSAYLLQVLFRLILVIIMLSVLISSTPLALPLRFKCLDRSEPVYCQDARRRSKSVAITSTLLTNVVSVFFTLVEFLWILNLIRTRHYVIYPKGTEGIVQNGCWCMCTIPTDRRFVSLYLKIIPGARGTREVSVLERFLDDSNLRILKETKYIEGFLPSETRKLEDVFMEPVLKESIIKESGSDSYVSVNWNEHKFHSNSSCTKKTRKYLQNLGSIFLPKEENLKEKPRHILITGETGMGKSTIALKLARQSALGQLNSQEYKKEEQSFEMVFLVDLKLLQTKKSLSFRELLSCSSFAGEIPNEGYEYIVAHPEEILLIFDSAEVLQYQWYCEGSEEEPANSLEEQLPVPTLYLKLVSGELFYGATVVTIARSAEHFKNTSFDKEIEVLGFTTEKIEEFARNFVQDCAHSVQEEAVECLLANSSMLSLCCIPQNCMLMCSYLQAERVQFDKVVRPATLTELYSEVLKRFPEEFELHPSSESSHDTTGLSPLTNSELGLQDIRPMDRDSEPSSIKHEGTERPAGEGEVSESQPGNWTRVLEQLSSVAFNGIEQGRSNFIRNDIELSRGDALKLEEMGILRRIPSTEDNPGIEDSFFFRKTTLQEFLAACKVCSSHDSEDKIKDLVEMEGKFADSNWDQVRCFVCGLLAQENPQRRRNIIEALVKDLDPPDVGNGQRKDGLLRTLRCVAEFQDPVLARDAASKLVPYVDLRGLDMTPTDTSAAAYVIRHASYHSIVNLDISDNAIGDVGAHLIAELLVKGRGPSRSLNLAENGIGNGGMKKVASALNRPECKMKSLNVAGNGIGKAAVEKLATVLAESPSCELEELDLSRNDAGSRGAQCIAEVLVGRHCRFTKLNLSSNHIGDKGAQSLVAAVASQTTHGLNRKLHVLNLSWNGISASGVESLAILKTSSSGALQELDLSGSVLTESAVEILSRVIESPDCTIKCLGLNSCGLGDAGMDRLSIALDSTYCGVTQLSLARNSISPAGAMKIAGALCSSRVTALNLGGNELGDEGAKSLADVLTHAGCNVVTLDLSRNNIGEGGAGCIAMALRNRNCVQNLNLHGNKIKSEGAEKLFGAVRVEKCKLECLLLGGNSIDCSGIAKLPHTFTSPHCNLDLLDLSGNAIGEEYVFNEFIPELKKVAHIREAGLAAAENHTIFSFQTNGRRRRIQVLP